MEKQSLDTKKTVIVFRSVRWFEEGGVRRSRPLPLLRKCWSIAQVAVVNSRGELICFYTLSSAFHLVYAASDATNYTLPL